VGGAAYQRLTGLDNAFLVYEDDSAAMHVASTQILEAAPLRASDGSIDIDRITDYVVSRLDRIPRYRQRLLRTPIEGHPVWADDPNFNVRYHVRLTALPRPGDERQLKRLVGRVFSQQLDRDKPLWELWLVEGLEGDRLALISKVHHCMVDGISGAELLAELLTSEPLEKVEITPTWAPRPMPGAWQLGVDEVTRVLRAPIDLAANALRIARDEDHARHHLSERMRALARLIADGARIATPTPFNRPVGPYRRVDWWAMPIARIREVRRRLGGSLNDVVLATASGALARYLSHSRGVDLDSLDFRIMAPVSVRAPEQGGTLGNRVSAWIVPLPLAERDPVARLRKICETTAKLKRNSQALGAETLTQVTEWTGSTLLSLGARLMSLGTPFNMVITNVPGPRVPLYLLEAPMLEAHPIVPLMGPLGVGIALFSYVDTLSWGFSADWDLVPDLHDLVLAVGESFEELAEAS
jgi:WS/DGAT/MGAT family acyltransferase